jgi:hypothetical protein
MTKRFVAAIAVAAFAAAGLILLFAKLPTTSEPMVAVSPISSSTSSPASRRTSERGGTRLTYMNPTYGFEFQYLPDWKLVVTDDKTLDLYGPHEVPGQVIPTVHLVIAENVERISINDWIERNKIELEIPQTEEGVLKYAVVPFGTDSAISFRPVLGGTDDTVYLLERSTHVFQFYVYLQEAPEVVKDEISMLISSFSFVE